MIKKAILMLTAGASLTMASASQAGLGWTLDECKAHYGTDGVPDGKDDLGLDGYLFSSPNYMISVSLDETGKVICETYITAFFKDGAIEKILAKNAPKANWHKADQASSSDPNKPVCWDGFEDGKEKYFAILTQHIIFGAALKKLQVSTTKVNDLIRLKRRDSNL
jgi:hypothetical protein